jgi:hypothetical protein
VPLLASDGARDERLRRLRDAYPVFRIQAADAVADGGSVQVTFTFTLVMFSGGKDSLALTYGRSVNHCSPLRPLYELQIIRSLAPHMDEYFQTQSCNKLKGQGWCLGCAKCAWVFLATTALFGRETAIAKAAATSPSNAPAPRPRSAPPS